MTLKDIPIPLFIAVLPSIFLRDRKTDTHGENVVCIDRVLLFYIKEKVLLHVISMNPEDSMIMT